MRPKKLSAYSARVDGGYVAAALGISTRAVQQRARKRAWRFIESHVRGGSCHLYRLADLPLDVRAAIVKAEITALVTDADELRRTATEYERSAARLSKHLAKQQLKQRSRG